MCSDADCAVWHADGESSIKSSTLAALDKSLGGVITEFVTLNEFAGKAVCFFHNYIVTSSLTLLRHHPLLPEPQNAIPL